jgi:hypothetical protein
MRESPDEAWMIGEQVHLWGNALLQAMYLRDSDPAPGWIERAGPEHSGDVLRILEAFRATASASSSHENPSPEEVDPRFLACIVEHPDIRVSLSRERDGRLTAYGFVIPLCRSTVELLPTDGSLRRLVERTSSSDELANLPGGWGEATIFTLSTVVRTPEQSRESNIALVRDVLQVIFRGGKYLSCTASDLRAEVLKSFGFTRVASGLGPSAFDPDRLLEGYALDLRSVGVAAWIAALGANRPVRQPSAGDDVT